MAEDETTQGDGETTEGEAAPEGESAPEADEAPGEAAPASDDE